MKQLLPLIIAVLYGLNSIAQETVTLNQKEKDAILYMREEEKLARDVYNAMYEKWEVNPFGNIRQKLIFGWSIFDGFHFLIN